MKHARKIMIACWVVVFLSLAALVVWMLTGYLFGIDTGFRLKDNVSFGFSIENLSGPYEQVGEYSVAADDIDSISVDWVAGEVDIVPYDGDTFRLVDYARRELVDGEKLVTSVDGNTLMIRAYENKSLIAAPEKKLELFIPASLADKLKHFGIDAVSADISLKGLSVGEMKIDNVSGLTELNDTVVSGSILASGVSGGIAFLNVDSERVRADTVSGDIDIEGSFSQVDAETISGGIWISSTREPDRIDCDTVSGDVFIFVPKNSDISVSHSSASGDFDSELAVRMVKSGAKFNFDTVSGDVELHALG